MTGTSKDNMQTLLRVGGGWVLGLGKTLKGLADEGINCTYMYI